MFPRLVTLHRIVQQAEPVGQHFASFKSRNVLEHIETEKDLLGKQILDI